MTDSNKTAEQIKEEVRKEIDKHLRVLKEKINKFLSEEKPPDVLIIKSHLICEYYLNQILILREISTAKEIDKLSFFDKTNKSLYTQNPNQENIHDRLIRLNKLRNKVGHELEYVLSESDVDSLGYLSGKEYVLNKFDYDKTEKLLRNTLILLVIDVSMLVFDLVSKEKNKPKPILPTAKPQQSP